MDKYTIKEIALEAGVSKSTVSRVLNNRDDVNEVTRKKVLEVIDKTGYIQNRYATNLSKKKEIRVLIFVTRLYSYTENEFISGFINNKKENIEYSILESNFDFDFVLDVLNKHENEYDYIIYFATSREDSNRLKHIKTPIYFIGQNSKYNPSFTVNNKCMIREVMNKCVTVNDINKMLYLSLPISDYTSGFERKIAVEKFCKDKNIELDIIYTTFSARDSYNMIKDIDISKYDFIGCATDKLALAVDKKKFELHNKSIPVFGIGNYEEFNFIFQNFTTIDLDFYNTGKLVSNLILDNNVVAKNYEVTYKIITL